MDESIDTFSSDSKDKLEEPDLFEQMSEMLKTIIGSQKKKGKKSLHNYFPNHPVMDSASFRFRFSQYSIHRFILFVSLLGRCPGSALSRTPAPFIKRMIVPSVERIAKYICL